jgi:hypothetical protein
VVLRRARAAVQIAGMPKLHVQAGDVPGIVFTPRADHLARLRHGGPLPLVLLGHGAHFGKDDPTMQALCWGLAYGVPGAVLCIDAPHHGERRPAGTSDAEFDTLVRRGMSDPETHARLATDWQAAAKAARDAMPVIDARTAYAGFSMGSVFGVSIAADLGNDSGPLVFAVGGLRDEATEDTGAEAQNELMRAGASRLVDRDVLMLNMTRDEHFPLPLAVELLESLPTTRKRMFVWQGTHVDLPPEALAHAAAFLRDCFARDAA